MAFSETLTSQTMIMMMIMITMIPKITPKTFPALAELPVALAADTPAPTSHTMIMTTTTMRMMATMSPTRLAAGHFVTVVVVVVVALLEGDRLYRSVSLTDTVSSMVVGVYDSPKYLSQKWFATSS